MPNAPTINIQDPSSTNYLAVNAAGQITVTSLPPTGVLPQTQVFGTGTTAAGAQVVATLTGAANVFTYLTDVIISLTTGTAGVVTATITGTGATTNIAVATPATGANVYQISFSTPLKSSAVNTNIVVTVPAIGGATAVNTVSATGYLA